MTGRRLARACAVVAFAAGALATGASAAIADGELEHEWASDSVHLAWDGTSYAVTTTSFIGLPVAVPGDRATRTVKVTNGGPTTGVLEAWIIDVELVDAGRSRFFDDLTVDWTAADGGADASMRELASAGQTRIGRAELEPGESTLLTVGYELPLASTAGNRADDGALEASFDVRLRIEGAADGEAPDDETPDDETPDDETPDDRDPGDELPRTGSETRDLVVAVAWLLVVGVTLIFAARRSRRKQG